MESDASDTRAATRVSRREALLGLAAGIVGLPRWLEQILEHAAALPVHAHSSSSSPASPPAKAGFLSATERAQLRNVCDRVLPRTEWPGALDTGVPEFIDLYLTEVDGPGPSRFRRGLSSLEHRCRLGSGRSLAEAPPAAIDTLLAGLESLLKTLTAGNAVSRRQDHELIFIPVLRLDTLSGEQRVLPEFYLGLKWLILSGYSTSEAGARAMGLGQLFHAEYVGCTHGEHKANP